VKPLSRRLRAVRAPARRTPGHRARLPVLDAAALCRHPHDATDRVRVTVLAASGTTTSDVVRAIDGIGSTAACEVRIASRRLGRVPGIEPSCDLVADTAIPDVPPTDVLLLPGGLGWHALAADVEVVRWIRDVAAGAPAVLAISTGANVAAAAGLLDGEPATGHWLARRDLAALGARAVDRPVAEAARVVTAAGAASARDAGRRLAHRLSWAPR
jgi:transcriptional regulator GlxA family with amidase domain